MRINATPLKARIGASQKTHGYIWLPSTGVAAPAGAAAKTNPNAARVAIRTSLMPPSYVAVFSLLVGQDPERLGDPRLELGRDGVTTPRRDDLAEFHLEVESVRARRAPIEVSGDDEPTPDGQL